MSTKIDTAFTICRVHQVNAVKWCFLERQTIKPDQVVFVSGPKQTAELKKKEV